jgi:hypothetical protein
MQLQHHYNKWYIYCFSNTLTLPKNNVRKTMVINCMLIQRESQLEIYENNMCPKMNLQYILIV